MGDKPHSNIALKPCRNHLALGRGMFKRVKPDRFPQTQIRYRNQGWAQHIGIGDLSEAEWIDRFAHFKPFPGSLKAPLALAYHGHQFGVYNPDIGDGRGFLYAQMRDPVDGKLLDFGTKGSGQTPFSRSGDGRLTLKGAVREVIATEMLTALGVNTSQTFSIIETGEQLQRQDEPSPTRSAVLVRLSHGHIRIGSFQRLAYNSDNTAIEHLLRYCAKTYFHDRLDHQAPMDALAVDFIAAVAENLATLVASWMAAGFVHGVLNTDNFNITGESFDYGPWRFLPRFEPGFTAAYFDHQGRYAYGRQPDATFWALCRLAECFTGFASTDALEKALQAFNAHINTAMIEAVSQRLGINSDWPEAETLIQTLFAVMVAGEVDFEEVFFDWYGGCNASARADSSKRRQFYTSAGFASVKDLLAAAPAREGITLEHGYFARQDPFRMLIDDVEALWTPIARSDDWAGLEDALATIELMADGYGNYPVERFGGVVAKVSD